MHILWKTDFQNVKDAAEGQNDYKMSGLLSNATFIDKAVYHSGRHDSVTLSPLLLQRGLRFGTIQRNGAAPEVIHTGVFFVLIPLKWLEKLTGVKDKYI